MQSSSERLTRRGMLKGLSAVGAVGAVSPLPGAAIQGLASRSTARADIRPALAQALAATPIVDTHEHLPEEEKRLQGRRIACDDWALLFSHYLDSDLVSAGMPQAARDRLLGRDVDPVAKWRIMAPYWPEVKNTGYGQAVRIAIEELYGIDELIEETIARVQQAYLTTRRPGFYREILVEPLLRGNARKLFSLEEKNRRLAATPWF